MYLFIFTHVAMVYFFSIFVLHKWGKIINVMGQDASRASCPTGTCGKTPPLDNIFN